MTIQERQGALWALQIVAKSRYTLEVTKVAMQMHDHPRWTADSIKSIFWPNSRQFRAWLLPKSLRDRYIEAGKFYSLSWEAWQDLIIRDADSLVEALNDNDFQRVRHIMANDRITAAYSRKPHKPPT